jgi:ribosomal protein S18 acetylase RimI-like enzyme
MINPTVAIQIRAATQRDVDDLVMLEGECFKGVYANHRWGIDQFRYYLRNPLAIVLIAECEGRPVGYAAGILSQGRLAHMARLHSIGVLPRYRGEAIGRKLLEYFFKEVQDGARRELVLEVSVRRSQARRLFERAGFTVERRLPGYYAPDEDALRLRKSFVDHSGSNRRLIAKHHG